MKWSLMIFLGFMGGTFRLGRPTCVLESDFGFIINCAFKKSGLFRVRNLGGVKAHIGLGFTVGDELGFKESISNVEVNRRRSAQASKLQAQLIQAQHNAKSVNSIQNGFSDSINSSMNNVLKKREQLGSTIPPFKPIPPAPERLLPSNSSRQKIASPQVSGIAVPSYSAMPSSISKIPMSQGTKLNAKDFSKVSDKFSSSDFALRTLQASNNEIPSSNSIHSFLLANNVTEDALEVALLRRQAMLTKNKISSVSTPSSISKISSSLGKVMNAPKEYYPVGYDKNFDDNFVSRVELPETSFYCGDQKHFPGLYADEDLGCMVFHVCALTDEGLIMKSFLCPESTLFDQTILKCNWWFYVDCKASKKLYDSNIPISKSYQLMKALTFFSAYKKETATSTQKNSEED